MSASNKGLYKNYVIFFGGPENPRPPLCHPPVIKLRYPPSPHVIDLFDDAFQNSNYTPSSVDYVI